jgi:hypothetical protein
MQQLPQTINNPSEREDGKIIEENCKMLPFLCLTSKNCWMLKLFQIDYGCNYNIIPKKKISHEDFPTFRSACLHIKSAFSTFALLPSFCVLMFLHIPFVIRPPATISSNFKK